MPILHALRAGATMTTTTHLPAALPCRFDTSAYSGEGIEEAMRCLVEKILSYPDIFHQKREKHAIFKPEAHNGFTDAGCC